MMSKKLVQCCLAAWLGLLADGALAASAGNHYVTVSSDTAGVEAIVPVDDDFYVTTRGVSAPEFVADVSVTAHAPWKLVKPASGKLELGIGESGSYKVEDETGTEDDAEGSISVLKLDIEPDVVNVSWTKTQASLSLTSDSVPGGVATWSSEPAGISGSGSSIAFNPNSLAPGEYTVTATSGVVPDYSDTCVVRVISVGIDDSELWFFRSEEYGIPVIITPSSAADLVSVSVSGFDDVHWTAAYESPLKKNRLQQPNSRVRTCRMVGRTGTKGLCGSGLTDRRFFPNQEAEIKKTAGWSLGQGEEGCS